MQLSFVTAIIALSSVSAQITNSTVGRTNATGIAATNGTTVAAATISRNASGVAAVATSKPTVGQASSGTTVVWSSGALLVAGAVALAL